MRILAVWFVTVFPLFAQIGGSGSIQGVVSDPSGAVIPGATVEGVSVATGLKTVRQTTAAGLYLLSPLVPGELGCLLGAEYQHYVRGFRQDHRDQQFTARGAV